MACASCENPLDLYLHNEPLGINAERHAELYRCPSCSSLYEMFPEVKMVPKEISEAEARRLFPAVEWSSE